MKDTDTALKHLWALKNLGVGIAMDDFGTGYSSLSYLNSFPFSKLKIDQSFVRMENSPKSRALVQAIISLGASLNMKTIAEGIETQAQFDELAAGGCLEAQGYLISRPILPKAITDFINNSKNKCIW
jgi:EAL domain-containing protein (putative c-di-GMP-specific phosphodiesterase class I)